jgi:hypothetical protein
VIRQESIALGGTAGERGERSERGESSERSERGELQAGASEASRRDRASSSEGYRLIKEQFGAFSRGHFCRVRRPRDAPFWA